MIGESQVRTLQLPAAFHVYRVEAVHENVGDSGIRQEGLQRTETHDIVLNLPDDGLPLLQAERCLLFSEKAIDILANFLTSPFLTDCFNERQVENLEELLVDSLLPVHFYVRDGVVSGVCFPLLAGCMRLRFLDRVFHLFIS